MGQKISPETMTTNALLVFEDFWLPSEELLTAGGVSAKELNFKTFAQIHPNLCLASRKVLDIEP